jgi:hypothetical protein
MRSCTIVVSFLAAVASARNSQLGDTPLLKDIDIISKHWGQITPYFDNEEDYFGVDYVGLPDGCQVVRNPVL